MSIRSLIEINHDLVHTEGDQTAFLRALQMFVNSGSKSDALELERFGLKVIGQRHHSSVFYIEDTADGFPVKTFPAKP